MLSCLYAQHVASVYLLIDNRNVSFLLFDFRTDYTYIGCRELITELQWFGQGEATGAVFPYFLFLC